MRLLHSETMFSSERLLWCTVENELRLYITSLSITPRHIRDSKGVHWRFYNTKDTLTLRTVYLHIKSRASLDLRCIDLPLVYMIHITPLCLITLLAEMTTCHRYTMLKWINTIQWPWKTLWIVFICEDIWLDLTCTKVLTVRKRINVPMVFTLY